MADCEDNVRVLRLIEYEGPRSLVEAQVANSIHGTRFGLVGKELSGGWPKRQVRITVTTLGVWPEVIEGARQTPDPGLVRGLQSQITKLTHELEEAKRGTL